MIQFTYQNSEEDIITYYEFILQGSPETLKQRRRVAIMGPGAALILLIGIRPKSWWWWLIAVLFSVIWVLFLSRMMYNDVIRTAAKREFRDKNVELVQNTVRDENGRIFINEAERPISNYYGYLNLIIITLDHDETVIIPERVFTSPSDEKQFIRDVVEQTENHHRQQKGA